MLLFLFSENVTFIILANTHHRLLKLALHRRATRNTSYMRSPFIESITNNILSVVTGTFFPSDMKFSREELDYYKYKLLYDINVTEKVRKRVLSSKRLFTDKPIVLYHLRLEKEFWEKIYKMGDGPPYEEYEKKVILENRIKYAVYTNRCYTMDRMGINID